MNHAEFRWTAPPDHPAFAGHFPGNPIVPGVVLLDRAIAFAEQWRGPAAGWQIGNAKFLHPVGPGAALLFALTAKTGGGVAFVVRNDAGRDVASGSLTPTP